MTYVTGEEAIALKSSITSQAVVAGKAVCPTSAETVHNQTINVTSHKHVEARGWGIALSLIIALEKDRWKTLTLAQLRPKRNLNKSSGCYVVFI